MALRDFALSTLNFDAHGTTYNMRASGQLILRSSEADYYPARLLIDALLSDVLREKIIRLVEEEIAVQLEATPTATGEPAKYDDEFADVPA